MILTVLTDYYQLKKRLRKLSILLNAIMAIGRGLIVLFAGSVLMGAILRYGFDAGYVQLQDLTAYTFSVLVLVSIAVAFFSHNHVKVNLPSALNNMLGDRRFRYIGALGFFAIAFLSLPTVLLSWSLWEGSKEPGGLGGVFLIKSFLPVSFVIIGIFIIFGKGKNETNQ